MTDTTIPAGAGQIKAILTEAFDALLRGDHARTEALLQEALVKTPADDNVLQLFGVLRSEQGRLAEAEDFYRRSLAAKPDQPQVLCNLGNLLRTLGRFDEALDAYGDAVRMIPNYAEPHFAIGLTLHDLGRLDESEKSYRAALRLQPNDIRAKQGLGALLNDMGRPKEAEDILRRAISASGLNPRQVAALEHNLGISMQHQHRFEDSLVLFDSAKARVPDLPNVDYNRANSLQSLGRQDEAVESYRRAVARDPLDLLAHRDLNQLLYRRGQTDDFLRSYDEAALYRPQEGRLPLAKANFLFQIDKFEAARENFDRAAYLLPGNPEPLDGLGLTLARLGEFDGAIRAHEASLELQPDNASTWRNFAETLLRAGDAEKGLLASQQSLRLSPDNQGTLAIMGTALRMLDSPFGAVLNDFENFVQVFELEPPQGYSDMQSFNAELNSYLDGLHRDRHEFTGQSLRGGTQTLENLFGRGHEPIERLRQRIDAAVAAFILRMKPDDNHPLLSRRQNAFGYTGSWSSRLHDCGFHTNHFHTKGWISSAYYVALPSAVNDAETRQGWIKFGEPAFETGLKNPIGRVVQPRVGSLILFPSYMWHGTVPFRSEHPRTTIAFDVVPR